MARPREFDRDEALSRAMDVFWEKGYDATSVQDLVDGMRIHRASLYDTFGSKQEIFCEALDLYLTRMEDALLGPLRGPGSPRAILAAVFRTALDQHEGQGWKGCLVVKSACMAGRKDDAAGERIVRFTERLDAAFLELLKRAQAEGELAPGKDCRALSRFLTHGLLGFGVSTGIRRNRRALNDISRTILGCLD